MTASASQQRSVLGKLIAILEKRTQEELRETLTGWGKEVLEQIEEVSIDLIAIGISLFYTRKEALKRIFRVY